MYERHAGVPRSIRRGRPSGAGFTLLELVISIVLMVSIVLVAGAAMRLGYRSLTKGQKMMDTLQRVRASFTIMNAQIQSAAPLVSEEDGSKVLEFEGAGDSLKFATNYSIWGGKRGHVLVEYQVRDDGGRQSLYAIESIAETGRQRETKLFQGYAAIYFLYSDTTDPDVEEEWTHEWSTLSKAPAPLTIT